MWDICSSACCSCCCTSVSELWASIVLWLWADFCSTNTWRDKPNRAFNYLLPMKWKRKDSRYDEPPLAENEVSFELLVVDVLPPGGCHDAGKVFSNQCLTEQWLGSRNAHQLQCRVETVQRGWFSVRQSIIILPLWLKKKKNACLLPQFTGKMWFCSLRCGKRIHQSQLITEVWSSLIIRAL